MVISGHPPTIGDIALETDTITHVQNGKIVIDAGTTVLFAFYSEYPGQVTISSGSSPAAK